ncbi:hypothetical protein MVEN_01830900 [Mycena venus]|uniref:RING-type domain-containing protein n=1 Tax=Mycena venus TaxID=2733690 RepID=A0A8H6XKQ1_9AGAR|nr:hypothetical protein MVEN_01830900 [Mycena venus]
MASPWSLVQGLKTLQSSTTLLCPPLLLSSVAHPCRQCPRTTGETRLAPGQAIVLPSSNKSSPSLLSLVAFISALHSISIVIIFDTKKKTMYQNVSIPEESGFIEHLTDDDDYAENYRLDLGSGAADRSSACPTRTPTPTPSHIRRPIPCRPFRPPRNKAASAQSRREAERECGICFELAVSPVRALCCAHLFCAEHISAWLHGPASDGLCPACRAPAASTGLLALGHPALLALETLPPPPPPSRSASPCPSLTSSASGYTSSSEYSSSSPSSPSTGYAAYPSTPISLPLSPASDPLLSSEEEEEDATDYSLPALVHARALQTRRHVPHPFSSVVGVRAGLGRVVRVAGWMIVVAVLAGRGRWATVVAE